MLINKSILRLSVKCLKSHCFRQCNYRRLATKSESGYHYQFLRLSQQKNKFVLSTHVQLISVRMAATWSMGPGTLDVPLSLFAKNRSRLANSLKKGQMVVLQGGDDLSFYDTDVQYVFRQVTFLFYYI